MAIEIYGIALKQKQSEPLVKALKENLINQAKHDWGQATEVEFHDGFIRIKLHSHFEDVPL